MTSQLPNPPPPIDPETQAFWAATAEGRLLLPFCTSCDQVFWYPRGFCPDCGSDELVWREASGSGTIYTFTIQHRLTGTYREAGTNVLAYVELKEGPLVMTNIVDYDLDQLIIGQEVEVVFHDTGESSALYRFRPKKSV